MLNTVSEEKSTLRLFRCMFAERVFCRLVWERSRDNWLSSARTPKRLNARLLPIPEPDFTEPERARMPNPIKLWDRYTL